LATPPEPRRRQPHRNSLSEGPVSLGQNPTKFGST
jgi:hypothetical protein